MIVLAVLGSVVVGYGFVYFQTEARIDRVYEIDPALLEMSGVADGGEGGVEGVGTSAGSGGSAVSAGTGVADGEDSTGNAGPGNGAEKSSPGRGSGGSVSGSGSGDRVSEIDSGTPGSEPINATLEWGEHIATTRGCRDCHGEDLGGAVFADEMPVFRLYGSNLTPIGVGASYSDEDWIRAIRHGVGPDGKPLLFMPSYEYYYLSDRDLGALIAYLKSLPAVDRDSPGSQVGPLGRVLFKAGKLPLIPAEMIDHQAPRPETPMPGATVAYGEYLAVGCTGCHGEGFSGGAIPGVPPDWPEASNITPDRETGLGNWTRADFFRAMREGRRPDGTELRAEYMPWSNFVRFSDQELTALWMYLETLEPRPAGGR
jgi:mono/diheme cytochrome c family protein